MDDVAQAAGQETGQETGASSPAPAKQPGDAKSGDAKSNGAKSNGAKPETVPAAAAPQAAPAAAEMPARFDIDEYRVEGADALPQIEVEEAVYPYLGPNRSSDDVEKARAALEKAYHDKGYQTVGVSVPQQNASRGFVVLKVTENRVGRLRVKGSRYYDLAEIKRKARSVEEGKLPNFNDVTKDIVSLNQWPDRRVTPALRAGVTPGTVDVDLNVEDKHPLHGSIELNNRQSPDTTPLRLNAMVRYDNLWQLGHSLSFTYQVAPQRPADAQVFSGSYLARTETDWLNLLFYGLKSDSSVATVGGVNVVGPGQVFGGRAVMTLPSRGELFHTLSVGVDYKDFEQVISLAEGEFTSPVSYVPLVASYGATWQGEGRVTQANLTATMNLRGIGSDTEQFDVKRYNSRGNFFILHGDVSHTHDLPGGFQAFAKAQGQIADQPLVSSEQISIGGLDTVRGYLESEALGDYGGSATLELRSPDLARHFEQTLENAEGQPVKFNVINDWRFFVFSDVGRVMVKDPAAEEDDQFNLASYGVGTRFRLLEYLNGLVLVGVPLTSQQVTVAHDPRLSFRFWGEF
ncbi:ShlB/FhaC/HecB family hemolysin secretion/activation protein [Blastochloris tepida]|uniref:ShlB/FhaC/HecB family hemolysin secretion/activation protein n=1 Tax=Blastochloris tepida TaxID=2233851 RepID=UPI001FCEC33C|nr:ShlB/FhaC/HecB family hemolysin secretion/activation protein [Blastochloris tepida]